jgi:hypothetical protein
LFHTLYSFKIYTTVSVPVDLYGCKTWSVKLREERRLREFGNGVLGRIYGMERYGVTGERRNVNNEQLNDLY